VISSTHQLPKVQMWQNAIPSSICDYLKTSVFYPSAPFWAETDYKERGYYSFW
jgi:hypothetical protein